MVYSNWHRLPLICLAFLIPMFQASCKQMPEGVGVFLETRNGWVKLPPFDFDSFNGGIVGTEDPNQRPPIPVAKQGGIIRMQGVAVDPSELYIGKQALTRIGFSRNTRVTIEDTPMQAEVENLGDNEFEVKVPSPFGNETPVEAVRILMVRKSRSSARAFFFRIR